jgi:hypothetical protein
MNPVQRRGSRRCVLAGSMSALAAATLARGTASAAEQSFRELLDLLALLEQTQIDLYQVILDAFDDAAFASNGLPEGARHGIEEMARAERAHLALVARLDESSATMPADSAPVTLMSALNEAAELENLAVAAYALIVPKLGRHRLIPELMGIHSVEARHAAWLATLMGEAPFPDAIDPSRPLDDVANRLGEFASSSAAPAADAEQKPLVAAIARDLGVAPEEITSVKITPRVWPDAALGCQRPGEVYAQVLTPGYLVEIELGGERHEFHTDERDYVVRCPSAP